MSEPFSCFCAAPGPAFQSKDLLQLSLDLADGGSAKAKFIGHVLLAARVAPHQPEKGVGKQACVGGPGEDLDQSDGNFCRPIRLVIQLILHALQDRQIELPLNLSRLTGHGLALGDEAVHKVAAVQTGQVWKR